MIAFLISIPFVFWGLTYFFERKGWSVMNYRGHRVPYQLGTIFMIYVSIAVFFNEARLLPVSLYFYFLILWAVGFIDDRYGCAKPKGIKGHVLTFLNEGKVTTGLVKAITIPCASFISIYVHTDNVIVSYLFLHLLLFILLPHTFNFLDTKPLRVLKISGFMITFVLIFQTNHLPIELTIIVSALFLCWGWMEGKEKGMLGDNGALLIGGIFAVIYHQVMTIFIQSIVLLLVIILTIISERTSIQAWVEKTPIIAQIDQVGRKKKLRVDSNWNHHLVFYFF